MDVICLGMIFWARFFLISWVPVLANEFKKKKDADTSSEHFYITYIFG